MKIYLRTINENDTPLILKWRNSPNVSNHCFNRHIITEESHKNFYESNILTGKYKQFIVERVDEQYGAFAYPIATVYLKDIDTINNRCELCIFTSDDEEWNTESQVMAVNLLLEKAFHEYNMHKVYTYVFADFIDKVNLLTNVGFSVEVLLKDEARMSNGQYTNVYRMSIFNKDE